MKSLMLRPAKFQGLLTEQNLLRQGFLRLILREIMEGKS